MVFWGEALATSSEPAVTAKVPSGKVRRADPRGFNTSVCVLPGCSDFDQRPSAYLLARIETRACGAVDLCVGFDDRKTVLPAEQPYRGRALWRKRPEFDLCTEEVARLFVDNRLGKARVITTGGGVRHDVPANAVATIEVPLPPCAALADVALDGETIGRLPVFPEKPDYRSLEPRDFVVDPDASRCYVATTFSYTPNGSSGGSGPSSQSLRKAWFHALRDRVDVPFLEKAPERIEAYAGYGSRTSLTETTCEPPSPPP